MHVAILHEISHIQACAQDFLLLPGNGQPVDVTIILKQFYDAINNRDGETLPDTRTFVKGYENFCKLGPLTPLEFIERVRSDEMLQAMSLCTMLIVSRSLSSTSVKAAPIATMTTARCGTSIPDSLHLLP